MTASSNDHSPGWLSQLMKPHGTGPAYDPVASVRQAAAQGQDDEALAGIASIARAAGLFEASQRDGSVTEVCARLASWCTQHRGLTLGERISRVLTDDRFLEWDGLHDPGPHQRGRFHVTEGVGATVGTVWVDATDEARKHMVSAMGARLRAAGFTVEVRQDRTVYVRPLPGEPRADLISPRPPGGGS